MTSTYITTTIPYVNARPHLGHAFEFVQADALARYYRGTGERVRLQAGTDDNALKNVLAARAAGVGVQEFVDANAAAFTGLAKPLGLSVDDTIRTSSDPRHRPGVERLWRACAARGDLYRRHYEGLYCVGCEQFYPPDDRQLPARPSITPRTARTSAAGGTAPPGASTSSARGCSASTRSLARDPAVSGGGAPHRHRRARLPHRERPQDEQFKRPARFGEHRRPVRARGQVRHRRRPLVLLRTVPKGADADFPKGRLVSRSNDELANGFGNLVNRVVSLICRSRAGRVPVSSASAPDADALETAIAGAPALIGAALADFDFRRATEAVWQIANEANRYVNHARPWALATGGDQADLDAVLLLLLRACQATGTQLAPFLPDAAARITRQCTPDGAGILPPPSPLLPRITGQ